MNSETVSGYLKWNSVKVWPWITFIAMIAMLTALSFHGFSLYTLFFSNNLHHKNEQVSKTVKEIPPLKEKDFELLFGSSSRSDSQKSTTEIPKTRLNLILRGVLGHQGQSGQGVSAIIQGNNQDKLYVVGDLLPGGATLTEVYSDHVILDRNGQLEKLYFPDAGNDSRVIQEYNVFSETTARRDDQPGFTKEADGKSLEQRMQGLRAKLQQANQGI